MCAAIREAYAAALVKYGKDNADVIVLDADVSCSTKSDTFEAVCPERFFNVGIAEANMNAMACGMASAGKTVFTNTFAAFTTSNGLLSLRALASYNHLNVKVMGAYGGLSDSFDGPTHHSIDDLAIMSALPGFTVCVASDEHITDFLVKTAIDVPGPFYIRLSREAFPELYTPGTDFALGKARTVKQGTDVTIISCGVMVGKALAASGVLEKRGCSAGVMDCFTIKPIDRQAIIDAAKSSKALVVAEEHNMYGGLGSIVGRVLLEEGISIPVGFVAIKDMHAESGGYGELLDKYGLGVDAVVSACEKILR